MKCKKCGREMGTGEASIEYCDGYCVECYETKEEVNRRRFFPSFLGCQNNYQPSS